MQIKNVFDFNKALAMGPYADGGYPFFFVTADNGTLSFASAQAEQALIRDAIIGGWDSQWLPVELVINWDDTGLYCDHTGDRIASAYGED